MAFDTGILAGGFMEHDAGVLAYKRVLAIRESVLATTDAAGLIAFDADFVSQWGFDSLAGMKALSASQQERVVLWARMRLIAERADFNAVALPNAATEPYFYTHHESLWLNLDTRLLWLVVASTERWAAIELRSVDAGDLDTFLADCKVAQFGLEAAMSGPVYQLQTAVALIRIFDTDYDAITDMDEHELDFEVEEVHTRMFDRNYQTHLQMMGWLAEGLQTIVLANQRAAFNALTQTDFGEEAVAPLVAEMVELFRRLGGMTGNGLGLRHDVLVWQAEMVAHGYTPEVLFQLMGFLPGEPGIDTPGAIWVEFPAIVANEKIVECALKAFVPEGVTLRDLTLRLSHDYANALVTRYANALATGNGDADDFAVNNLDDAGVGKTEFIAHSDAGLTGGAGGTVYTLGLFELHYDEIGTPSVRLAPRVYWMNPEIVAVSSSGGTLAEATITVGSATTVDGNTITLDDGQGGTHVLTAGTDFDNGATAGSANALADSIAAAIEALPGYIASATTGTITVQSLFPTPDPIAFAGAELVADVGGASEAFAPAVVGADGSSNFFAKGLRFLSGLKNDGGRNYLFPEMMEGLRTP